MGFSHPDGADFWLRVPMGVRNGPLHFQRCVNTVLVAASLQRTTGAFIDDLMNGAKDHASNVLAVD